MGPRRELFHFGKKFWILESLLDSPGGGVLTMVSKTMVPNFAVIDFRVLVKGRITRSFVPGTISTIVIWNVHNFGINSQDWIAVNAMIASDLALAQSSPDTFCSFLFSGI